MRAFPPWFSCCADWLLERVQDQHNYPATSRLARKATSSTKPHSTGQVAFARCIFWQLHQINLFSHLCVKSISSLILGWKGCNYPSLIKTVVYQASQQGGEWTCWIWNHSWCMAEAPQQPARYARLCMDVWEERDVLLPLAWLLSFFMGDWFELTGHEPTPTNCWARCKGTSHQPAPRWAAVSPSPFKPASRSRLPVSSLPSPPHALRWRCRQSPPLHKVHLVWYGSLTLGPRQNQEKPRSCNRSETEAELGVLLYLSSWYEFKDTVTI